MVDCAEDECKKTFRRIHTPDSQAEMPRTVNLMCLIDIASHPDSNTEAHCHIV